jgi:hypothetical protein
MPDRPDQIVAEIPKSARESVRVILREKSGQLGADLRIASTTGRGPMRETAKDPGCPVWRGDRCSSRSPTPRRPGGRLTKAHHCIVEVTPLRPADQLTF